ncbi:MAG TPA: cupin domain-containing protein [Noviherbaspirillum sp.]|uniref:cupin domain-containing protein n=1 Tax=Noviherbaspirillum sp. TaxID=1926288 RepID=UPI002B465FF6|nr:cupin domain-containing protein [Noviherbaspirillum sp.]HJV86132.1 cupin domain-containing protein [Noviherbaspirillum sp.]
MDKGNLYAAMPAQLPEEFFQVLAEGKAGKGARIERIVSKGHRSPPGFWYDQPENEWVTVLQGRAALRFEQGDRVLELAPGDYVNIPAHEKHRVEWTAEETETVWLAVFY